MKTSVIMARKMGDYLVHQRTKDGYFDASSLLNQWNLIRDNPERKMLRFLESPKTKEFINTLIIDAEETPSAQMHFGDFQAFIIKKGRNTQKGRTNDEVWMHPYLFIDFSMWLNPKFKLSVIKFIYDQLIEQRKKAGDNYKTLSSSVYKLEGHKFKDVAEAMQYIVYGRTGKNLRQVASESQLIEINDIQKKLSFAIDSGLIKTYAQLLDVMRDMYRAKYPRDPF